MIWQENEVIEFYDSTQSQKVGGCEPCSHHKTKTDKAIIIWRVPLSTFCKSWQLHMFSKTRQKSKTQSENKELHRPMDDQWFQLSQRQIAWIKVWNDEEIGSVLFWTDP